MYPFYLVLFPLSDLLFSFVFLHFLSVSLTLSLVTTDSLSLSLSLSHSSLLSFLFSRFACFSSISFRFLAHPFFFLLPPSFLFPFFSSLLCLLFCSLSFSLATGFFFLSFQAAPPLGHLWLELLERHLGPVPQRWGPLPKRREEKRNGEQREEEIWRERKDRQQQEEREEKRGRSEQKIEGGERRMEETKVSFRKECSQRSSRQRRET